MPVFHQIGLCYVKLLTNFDPKLQIKWIQSQFGKGLFYPQLLFQIHRHFPRLGCNFLFQIFMVLLLLSYLFCELLVLLSYELTLLPQVHPLIIFRFALPLLPLIPIEMCSCRLLLHDLIKPLDPLLHLPQLSTVHIPFDLQYNFLLPLNFFPQLPNFTHQLLTLRLQRPLPEAREPAGQGSVLVGFGTQLDFLIVKVTQQFAAAEVRQCFVQGQLPQVGAVGRAFGQMREWGVWVPDGFLCGAIAHYIEYTR